MDIRKNIINGMCLAIGIASLGFSVFSVGDLRASQTTQSAENRREMERISSEISRLEKTPTVTETSVSEQVSLCSELGEDIARMQMVMHNEEQTDDEIVANANYIGDRLSSDSQTWRGTWGMGITDAIRWEFIAPNSYSGSELSVAWLGYSEVDAALLAYGRATYVESDNQFHNMVVRVTSTGQARVGVTSSVEDGE